MDIEAYKTRRNKLFQELKPTCVRLSQLALKDDGTKAQLKTIEDCTAQLLGVLRRKCRESDTVFDDKLADYVFFPLSHILKKCQKSAGRLAELATQCVRLLLEQGWRKSIAIELAHQLLLLLTFFAGGGPSTIGAAEELRTEAYGALSALFRDLQHTPKGSTSLVEDTRIPAVGQCLTVILEGIVNGPSSETQSAALAALSSIYSCIKDQKTRANFLPGTISTLTKCLMPNIKTPRKRKVLVKALGVLETVLALSLGDVHIMSAIETGDQAGSSGTLSSSWMKATGSQIKLALGNVLKLRKHEHEDVRVAVRDLCINLLEKCSKSLAESAPLLIETSMNLSECEDKDHGSTKQTSLSDLAAIYPTVAELVKLTIYNWSTSFPRIMQSNDETSKHDAMQQLSNAHRLLASLEMESETLNAAVLSALHDGIISAMELSRPNKIVLESQTDNIEDASRMLAIQPASSSRFCPVIMPHGSQAQSRDQLWRFINSLGSPDTLIKMAKTMLGNLERVPNTDSLSAFWLAFQLLKAAQAKSEDVNSFLSPDLTSAHAIESVMEELYAHSLSVLTDLDDAGSDWRLKAIGLEVVASLAEISGQSFRPDLVDALYPVVHLLGSPSTDIRNHAIASLNQISKSCGYQDTSKMIVDNVDYLVNAISLKLNTFDISPQAPRVLFMMIKLSGPSLLPYLDDVVASIFTALDNFHGYPRLVEILFSVLGQIVQEGSRSSQLLPTTGPNTCHRNKALLGPTMSEIAAKIRKSKNKVLVNDKIIPEDFPRGPWKSAKTSLNETEQAEVQAEEGGNAEPSQQFHVQEGRSTKIYAMVESIARQGQYHLTSQSPLLRHRLLDLITTACHALHENEDKFLPLVNDIWPVLIKRLYDEEPFVVIAASRAVAQICKFTSDFVFTRIQVEWQSMLKLIHKTKDMAEAESKGRHARGIYAQNWQLWQAFISLLVTVVEYIHLDDDMLEGVLSILADLLPEREDVRRALSAAIPDAVWLQEYVHGNNAISRVTPVLHGFNFVHLGRVLTDKELERE